MRGTSFIAGGPIKGSGRMPFMELKRLVESFLKDANKAIRTSVFPPPELLPLSAQTRRSLYYFLLDAGAPAGLIEEACGMLDGLHACLKRAEEFAQKPESGRQAQAYRQTAREVELRLTAFLQAKLFPCSAQQEK